ncbi:MAG TPA: DUF1801 domain-containing protein [Candidatus Limnocylindrales bacterium]|nr:DUF1801 domain-containing protein [Candidatus Limnocylindrales bacterium]
MATSTRTRAGGSTDLDSSDKWTDAEIGAMKAHAKELKDAKKRTTATDKAAEGEQDLLSKIKEMPKADRDIAERIHAIVKATAPQLESRTWYGMPAYTREGKVVAFFKPASKFKMRYATLGFEDAAKLDDGEMWSTTFALTKLTPGAEKQIAALIKKAAG